MFGGTWPEKDHFRTMGRRVIASKQGVDNYDLLIQGVIDLNNILLSRLNIPRGGSSQIGVIRTDDRERGDGMARRKNKRRSKKTPNHSIPSSQFPKLEAKGLARTYSYNALNIMTKSGWVPGRGLGKKETGRTDLIPIRGRHVRQAGDRTGLGYNSIG